MNKMQELMAKKKEKEREELEKLKQKITLEIEPEIKIRVRKELEEEYKDKKVNEKDIRKKVEEEVRKELAKEITLKDNKSLNLLSLSLREEFNKRLAVLDDIEDISIRNFLKVKSTELFLKGADYALNAGRIGQEVFEELGKKGSTDGLYTKWVELSGFSESTMKRYRNRWEVFSSVKKNVKPFILLLSHSQINKILKREEIKELIYSTEDVTYDDLLSILEEPTKQVIEAPKEIEFPKDFSIENFTHMLKNVDEMNEEKKIKFYKLLEEITKLMKA